MAYPKGRPYCKKSDPAPPEIGRGSKRALTQTAPESLTASREAAGDGPRVAGYHPPSPAPRGGLKRAQCAGRSTVRVDPRRYKAPPYNNILSVFGGFCGRDVVGFPFRASWRSGYRLTFEAAR